MDSGSRTGLTILLIGAAAVIALMVRVRGHMFYEGVLGVFLALQLLNAVLILRGDRLR